MFRLSGASAALRVVCALLVLPVSACTPDEAPENPVDTERSIVMDSRFAPGPDTLGDGVQEFVDALESTSGLTLVTADPSNGAGILNAVNAGDIDLGIDILTLEDSGDAELNAVLRLYGDSVPFGMGVEQYVAWMTGGGGLDLLHSIMIDDHGYHPEIRITPVIANTGQAAGMFKIEPSQANFEQGFLMRTFGFGQAVTAMAYPEMSFIGAVGGSVGNIVAGLNGDLTGENCPDGVGPCELMGAEFVNPCIDANLVYSAGIEAEYYYTNEWQTPATISFLIYRADRFSTVELAAIDAAAAANVSASRPRLQARQPECLDDLTTDHGQTIGTLETAVLDDLEAAWDIVRAERASENERVAEVLDSMASYAGD